MIDDKTLIALISRSTQEECRQIGDLFLLFAGAPRDVHWEAQMRRTLAMFPDPPKSDLTVAINASRARVTAREDELFATGWHPDQMAAKLAEFGYTGVSTGETPSVN